MRLFILCLLGILSCITFAQAKEEQKTYIIDWSQYPNNKSLESNKCGKVSLNIPQYARIDDTALILKIKTSNKEDIKLGASFGDKRFTMICATKGSNYEGFIKFNDKKNIWEFPNKKQEHLLYSLTPTIYQLNTNNIIGWLSSSIVQEENYRVKQGLPPYFKVISFCIFNKSKTKNICGDGIAQYILDKKHLGTTAHDYTPDLIQILETLKFEDEK